MPDRPTAGYVAIACTPIDMATMPQLTEDRESRIHSVLEDVDRSRKLVADSRRKRAVYASRLQNSRKAITVQRHSSNGIFGWFTRSRTS